MTHRPELLSAMLDGELAESESKWVAGHLAGCDECRSELDDLATARTAVRSLPLLDLPDDVDLGATVAGATVTALPRKVAVALTSVAAAAVVGIGALGLIGVASEGGPAVDVAEVGAILAATSSLPPADNSEVAMLISGDPRARYSARQTMACRGEDGFVDATVDVTRIGQTTVMSDPLAMVKVLTGGSVSTGPAGGPIKTVTVTGAQPSLGDYAVVASEADEHRGRQAEVVTLARDGVERARVWVDEETGAIVHRQLLDADGSVACVTDLVEFEPIDRLIQLSIPFAITAEVVEHVYQPVAAWLPDMVGGMELAATYEASGGHVGVYGDGVFMVAVVAIDGGEPTAVLAENDWLQTTVWQSDGVTWAVVGSLPDDLMGEVLASLPAPTAPNPIAAGWRILFG